jgi:hypothetical protein
MELLASAVFGIAESESERLPPRDSAPPPVMPPEVLSVTDELAKLALGMPPAMMLMIGDTPPLL